MSEWINAKELPKPLLEINFTKPVYVKYENNKMYISSEPKEGFKLHPFFEMMREKKERNNE